MHKLSKAEKVKRGTYDGRTKTGTPGTPLSYIPDAPQWLSETAKDVFLVVCADLFERGLLFDADVLIIAAYATQTAQFIELTEQINREGYTIKDRNKELRKHPVLVAQKAAYTAMIQSAKSLGLSPYFRDKVSANIEPEEKPDPLAAYMN